MNIEALQDLLTQGQDNLLLRFGLGQALRTRRSGAEEGADQHGLTGHVQAFEHATHVCADRIRPDPKHLCSAGQTHSAGYCLGHVKLFRAEAIDLASTPASLL